jgi:YidC/Oxa1 family membrane protein insertase
MESGRFLLAVVLMIAVVVITNILIPPVEPVDVPATGPDPGAPPVPSATTPPPPARDPAPAADQTEPADTRGPEQIVTIESDVVRFGFSNRGAALVSAELLQYESFSPDLEGGPVQLQPDVGRGLIRHRIRLDDHIIDLDTLAFETRATTVSVTPGAGPETFDMTWSQPDGVLGITITYTVAPDSYVFDVSGRVTGTGTTPQLLIDMGPTLRSNEVEPREDQTALSYVINSSQTGIVSTALDKVGREQIDEGPLRWVAIKNKYFVVAAMESVDRPTPFGGVIARPNAEPYSADLTATLLGDDAGAFGYRLYVGPQQADRLAAIGNQLQDVSVFGWRFLQPVLRPLGHAITWALLQIHRALDIGYGWVLILFGFLIRFVLWPLNAKAMRSQLKNMEMQPRIKEIQARHKGDPQKLQQEMLKLYKEEGFNPMGGCLPMLLPLPVLITLFFVFQATIEFRGVPFLWLPDLSLKDPLYILPVALGVSMFIQQWLNMKSTKDAPAQMKYMTYIMPVVLTVLFVNFASGLNLYYASMNIASVPQQLQIMREKKKRAAVLEKKV